MADQRTSKSDQPSDEEAKATDQGAAAPNAPAVNPVDLGTDVDKLPPVPGPGQFMAADQATEPTSPATTEQADQKKG